VWLPYGSSALRPGTSAQARTKESEFIFFGLTGAKCWRFPQTSKPARRVSYRWRCTGLWPALFCQCTKLLRTDSLSPTAQHHNLLADSRRHRSVTTTALCLWRISCLCLRPDALGGERVGSFGSGLSCFGCLISRLPRFCPLATTKRPFDESGAFPTGVGVRRLEVVLRRHPFMAFVVVADTILRRLAPRRQGAGNAIDARGLGPVHEPAAQPDRLSYLVEMRRGVRADWTGGTSRNIWNVHDVLLSFSSAASRSAGLIGTI